MSAMQWEDVFTGEPPDSLKDLHCDGWVPKEDGKGGWLLLCLGIFCDHTNGWYRPIPEEDLEKARELSAAIDAIYEEEE